jgi:hypothetical protein
VCRQRPRSLGSFCVRFRSFELSIVTTNSPSMQSHAPCVSTEVRGLMLSTCSIHA